MIPATRTAVLFTTSVLAGLALLGLAADLDRVGTVSNLVADVLVGGAAVLVLRKVLLRRSRRELRRDVARSRAGLLRLLERLVGQYRGLLAWAAPLLRDDVVRAGQVRRPFEVWLPSDWDVIGKAALWFTVEHGAVDFAPVLDRLRVADRAVGEQWQRTRAALGEVAELETDVGHALATTLEEVSAAVGPEHLTRRSAAIRTANEALTRLWYATLPALADADLLLRTVRDGYEPATFAEQRLPDPFPAWITSTATVLTGLAGAFWAGSYVLADRLPAGVGTGTTVNVLVAGGVAFLAAALAVIDRRRRARRTVGLAAPAYHRLTLAALALHRILDLDGAERPRLLEAVDTEVALAVDQLQTIQPDARLGKYATALRGQIRQVLADPEYRAFRAVDPRRLAALGLPGDGRPPTPDTMRLLELAMRLTDRAEELFMTGRR